jgi:hypothetical protein
MHYNLLASANEVRDVVTVGSYEIARRWLYTGNGCATPIVCGPRKETAMAVNKPVGDNARKGAVRKRSQIKTAIEGEEHWTKRSRSSGQFMDQKKDPEARPFKGVLKEQ